MTVAFFTVTKNLLQKVINVTSADLSRSWLSQSSKDAETLETLLMNKHLMFETAYRMKTLSSLFTANVLY